MKNKYLATIGALLLFSFVCVSPAVVRSAGGTISGKITDPKGDAIADATVTVTESVSNRSTTVQTDKSGTYKIEGLASGLYSVSVSATGFTAAHQFEIKVEDNAVATVDLKLEIAPVEANVTVTAPSIKGNADPLYHQLRQLGKGAEDFAGPYATVTNLTLKRDAATFLLRSGEIYFAPEVNGRTIAAVFLGDGEFSLTPPTVAEKHSMELFTNEQSITEAFDKLVLHFTDQTFNEVKASRAVQIAAKGPQADRARTAYRDNESLLRTTLRRNMEMRTLVDLYSPSRGGFFTAFINGKRYNKLVFQYDPQGIPDVSPEEIALSSYGASDGGYWTAFHRQDEYAKHTASSDEEHRIYDITHHEIDGEIRGTRFVANDDVTFRVLEAGARVLPFNLFPSLRVARVKDEQGHDLDFIQENKNDDADFAVISPTPLEAGKTYKLNIEYNGTDALIDLGSGNFVVNPRARESWYPNNEGSSFGDRAIFDITVRHPKNKMFIGTGVPTAETFEGNIATAKWSSGTTPLAVAGFNYGEFKKKEVLDPTTGYNIEFYGNKNSLNSMRQAEEVGSMNTTAKGGEMLADAENSTRLFNAYFGKLPFNRLALTQQPAANFGQAWPTLVYMPFTAFMDATQRYMSTGSVRFATSNFFQSVQPHEIAHQWWGHLVGWKSYHDQWMSEGFAEFSASLYVQQILRDKDKYIEFWKERRDWIILARPATHDIKPYTIGPVTQGYRLSSGKTRAAYQFLVYPKGAYILHMLRQMMFDSLRGGDKPFMDMMQDFIKSHYNEDVSTEDLKRIVEKHMSKQMDLDRNGRMDWFFNEWVYGTEIPSYHFDYKIDANGILSGKITQSGVSDNFEMLVPVYVDGGKGWVRLGLAAMKGNSVVELPNMPLGKTAKRAAICVYDDVLALEIKNQK